MTPEEKELEKQAKLFKAVLYRRVNAIRPEINIDLSMQKRGIRFNDNQFIFDKIVEAVTDFRLQSNAAFDPTSNPTDFLPQTVTAGIYDRLIIDTLFVCSKADFIYEQDLKYH
jgi:hypothetical protein